MDYNTKEYLWSQKFRPRVVDDCILPESTRKMIKSMIADGEITHLLFSGGPGMGKTTLAYAIANELGSDVMYINASMENGIEILRTKIQAFASTVSLSDTGPKLVILDEADGSTPQFQAGLKGFLEAFSSNCRFIFTANHKSKIIEPIRSRATVVDFFYSPEEKSKIAAKFYRRVVDILTAEQIEFDSKSVAKLVEKNFPDFRKTLNELQRNASYGKIDTSVLYDASADAIGPLITALRDKDFIEARKWVAKNEDIDSATLFRMLYDASATKMDKNSVPGLVLILAEYGYKSAFVVDQQINTIACLLSIMSECKWN
jgi:DNA polymerase III delta prime subunit